MKNLLTISKRISVLGIIVFLTTGVRGELVPFKDKKLWGLQDENGAVVVSPKYTGVGDCSELYAWVNVGGKGGYEHCPATGKWGVIDERGVEVCPPVYDYVDFCNDRYVTVNKGGVINIENRTFTGGLWGIYDLVTRTEVVPCIYTQIGPINEKGVCWAQKDGKIARRLIAELVKDKKSKITDAKLCFYVEPDFEMKNMLLRHRDDGNWGLIDVTGKELTPFVYTKVYEFKDGYSIVYQKRLGGIVSDAGEAVVPCLYYELTSPGEYPVFWGKKDQLYALYNLKNEALSPEKYSEVGEFAYGVCWAKDSLYALVDIGGKELVAPTYVKVFPFYNGLATVQAGHAGVVNTRGEVVVPIAYKECPVLFGDNQFRPLDKNSPDCIGYVKDYDDACVWFDHEGRELVKNGKAMYGASDTIPEALWNY